MAFFEEFTKLWLPNPLAVIVVGVAAPIVFPMVGSVLRALTKEIIRGGLCLAEMVEEIRAETQAAADSSKAQASFSVAAPPSVRATIESEIIEVAEGVGEKALEDVEEDLVEAAVEAAVTALV
ncbi:MAG: hypothetical protein AB7P69_00865 [Candidatus Binatia bacterium]